VAVASGAAFTAAVVGRLANAFACRSTTRSVFARGWWRGNRLLLWAALAELGALVGFIGIPPIASLLDHRPPQRRLDRPQRPSVGLVTPSRTKCPPGGDLRAWGGVGGRGSLGP
jgi:hypothetical protein